MYLKIRKIFFNHGLKKKRSNTWDCCIFLYKNYKFIYRWITYTYNLNRNNTLHAIRDQKWLLGLRYGCLTLGRQ